MTMHEKHVRITSYRQVKLDPESRVALNATVIGDVELGPDVTVFPGAVIRGDYGERIVVGAGSNVQEGVSMHVDEGCPLTVGKHVIIGHNATVHGCTIDDGALVGMGSIIMNGAHVGEGAVIGAGALVPEGREVPPRAVMVGVPAKQIRELTDEEAAANAGDAQIYVEAGKQLVRDGIAVCGRDMPRDIPHIGVV